MTSNFTDAQIAKLEAKYQSKLEDCKQTILAQIRLHYEKDLGDIDDLLNRIFPKNDP